MDPEPLVLSQSREDRREYPVQLSPRISSSCTIDEGSVCECFELHTSSSFKEFLRHNPCPTIPGNPISPRQREKPQLLRSMAWSQDSQDEIRLSKRRKGEDNTTTLWGHRRGDSSPTMVHWEEKIVDPMDLSNILKAAITVSGENQT